MGPNRGSNQGQNKLVYGIAKKYGLTIHESRKLSGEVHHAKNSGAYDLDISGNLLPADIEEIAREILKARGT